MNKKRNVSYIKPEDPEFLKVLKRQAGYDDTNHKFDELQNGDDDFVDDEESQKPQVVVLRTGDLTAEEAEEEQNRIDKVEQETKADLSQRVLFKSKKSNNDEESSRKRKHTENNKERNKKRSVLSFDPEEEDDEC